MIQAVVLVGGVGTRLRPLTDSRPKPMVPLVDRPFAAHQIDHLRRHGITDVIFSCGYRPDALEAYFGDGSAMGVRAWYVVDPEPLGTAGAIKNAEPLIETDRIVVLNGDILTDLDLGEVIAGHREAGARGTIVLTPVEDPSPYGLVRLRADRTVEAFVEKPSPEQLRPGEPFRINAGTYVLERSVLDAIPAGRKVSIERETFPALAEEGRLFGHPSDSYWRDIGTPASYLDACVDVMRGAVRTATPPGGPHLGPGARVSPGAVVAEDVCLGAGAEVGEGAELRRSIVGDRSRVGAGASLRGAILGEGVEVGAGARLAPGAVVGDGAVIGRGCEIDGTVGTGAVVAPDERVPR